MAPEQLSAKVK